MATVSRILQPRSLFIALFGAIFASLCAPFALAATPAETFVQQNVQQGLAILADKSVAHDQTLVKFRAFLQSLTDLKRVALFTLGPAAKTAAPADVAFVHQRVSGLCHRRLSDAVQSLFRRKPYRDRDRHEHAPGDFIVSTKVADAQGRISSNADEVDFRVVSANGSFQILDASVDGIWIANNEREQFQAFLANNGNNVSALTAHVKERDGANSGEVIRPARTACT